MEVNMDEYTEFKVGDYILKSEVYSRDGAERYRRMSDFANENKLVMQETEIEQDPDDYEGSDVMPATLPAYIIAEPEPAPEPTPEEKARQEIARCKKYLTSTDWIAAKCYENGIDMHAKYPEECAKRKEARATINALENRFPELAE